MSSVGEDSIEREPLGAARRRPAPPRRRRAWSASGTTPARGRPPRRAPRRWHCPPAGSSRPSPSVPSVSSWPSCPTSSTVSPRPTKPPGLGVHLRDQRAGRVDDRQVAPLGLRPDRGGHAVGGEHHGRAVGHLVQLVDEHRALPLQIGARRARCARSAAARRPGGDSAAVPARRCRSPGRRRRRTTAGRPAAPPRPGQVGPDPQRRADPAQHPQCLRPGGHGAQPSQRRVRGVDDHPHHRDRQIPGVGSARTIAEDSMSTASAPVRASRSRSSTR